MNAREQAELPRVRLKIRVTGRHPRFYRKQVARPARPIPPGSLVFVEDKAGRAVGTGFYNARSILALRMLERGEAAATPARVLELVAEAIALRETLLGLPARTDAYRLVHAEGDGIPGLVLDKLGAHIVAQVFAKGIEPFLEPIGEALLRRDRQAKLVLRVDREARELEGIELAETGPLPEATLTEEGLRYHFRPGEGHKTGFFCDQRENRVAFGDFARGRRVLDLFCNGAGFAMHAKRGGAKRVTAIDLDEEAVALARRNVADNRLRVDVEHGDAFAALRDARGRYDCIVLDPPKWVRGERSEHDDGLARYLDANRLAFEALPKGGLLLTCSCSGAVSEDRFLAVLREAAARAHVDARVLRATGAGPDHPVALECPETRYLKAVWIALR